MESCPEDESLFKFYNDKDTTSFSDKYRPLKRNDYNRLVSKRSSKREPAITRLITSLAYKAGKEMVSLAEGMPNEEIFPFNKLQLQFKNGNVMEISGAELATALQYVPSQGLPRLVDQLRDFQEALHRPPPLDRSIIVSNGGQHGIYQCCELLVDHGDPVIMPEYTYTGVQVALKPYNPEILGIPEDSHGMRPEILEAVLESRLKQGLKMPKMLYTIPIGSNPTGSVLTEERKRHIYELACKYDFLILEDDPYMFLNYTDKPVPSFLSLDSCGRVLRLDSLSKVVSSGLRAGWVTAPTALVHRLELHTQAELLHSCSLAQVGAPSHSRDG
ncbi:aminotransferase class I and II domain-containing protein [Phthorimaea operculella]|nr:aminotransferase class I and II domain-containing protein [Phthorimaea operculella]